MGLDGGRSAPRRATRSRKARSAAEDGGSSDLVVARGMTAQPSGEEDREQAIAGQGRGAQRPHGGARSASQRPVWTREHRQSVKGEHRLGRPSGATRRRRSSPLCDAQARPPAVRRQRRQGALSRARGTVRVAVGLVRDRRLQRSPRSAVPRLRSYPSVVALRRFVPIQDPCAAAMRILRGRDASYLAPPARFEERHWSVLWYGRLMRQL